MVLKKAILDQFWKLSENKDNLRVDASIKICEHFMVCEEDETKSYVLSRLVKGLSTSKPTARKGFFSCLVEVLRNSKDDAEKIFGDIKNVLDEQFKHKGSKSEEGELLCGQLFALGAFLRSGKVIDEIAGKVVKDILEISKKRSYLRIPGYEFIIDFISQMNTDEFEKSVWPLICQTHDWKASSWSLETLWMILIVQERHEKVLKKSFMVENFGRKKLLTSELCAKAATAEEQSSIPIHIMKKHPVHEMLIKALSRSNLLDVFWEQFIEPTVSKGSSYRTVMAFLILDIILTHLEDKSLTSKLLTSNVVSKSLSLLSRIESPPEEDQVIFGVLAKFVGIAKENDELRRHLLKSLLSSPGNIAFDKLTGGNVIQQILNDAKKEDIILVGNLFKKAVLGESDNDVERTAQERIFAAHQLAKLSSHPAVQDDHQWRVELLEFLLATTLFDVQSKIKPLPSAPVPLSKKTRVDLKTVFFKALDFKAKNVDKVCSLLLDVAHYANDVLLKEASPSQPFGQEAQNAWKNLIKDIGAISKKRQKKISKKEDNVFLLFYLHMGFQLFLDSSTAIEVIADLKECYERATKKVQKRRSSRATKAVLDEDKEPVWVEVIVDLLISLQSHNMHVFRQLANSVFAMICPHMTTEAIQAILDVIKPSETNKSENDDKENEDEDDEEWEDMEGDEGDENEANEDEEVENDSESDEDEDDEKEDNDDDEVDELRQKIESALGEHAADSDDSIDMDDISEEDMKKMDEALANVFKQLSGKKSSKDKRKERKAAVALVHFKNRALDLIDTYLSHEPAMSHVLLIMETILITLENAGKKKEEKELEVRLKNSMKKLANLKKVHEIKKDENIKGDDIVEALQSLVELANKGSSLMTILNNPLPLFAQSATLLLKMSLMLDEEKLSGKMKAVYDHALESFFRKTNCMLPLAFFSIPMQGNWKESWTFADMLVKYAFDPTVRQFRRNSALILLTVLFHNRNLEEINCEPYRKEAAKQLEENILKCLRSSQHEVNPKFLGELLALLHAMHQAKADVDWTLISKSLEDFKERIPLKRNFINLKKSFNKIGIPLGLKPIQNIDKKRKRQESENNNQDTNGDGSAAIVNGENSDDEGQDLSEGTGEPPGKKMKKKKKKKKHNKEALQEKKKNKWHAVDGQFQGMEMPSFSGLVLNDNMNFVDKTDAQAVNNHEGKVNEEKKKGKKKKKKANNTANVIKE